EHEIRKVFPMYIQGAGGHLVQRRFPDMAFRLVDQEDMAGTEFPAQLGGEFQTAGPASDNDDPMALIRHALLLVKRRAFPQHTIETENPCDSIVFHLFEVSICPYRN